MFSKLIIRYLLVTFCVSFFQLSFAQQVTVINQKGTKIDVVNNKVFTSATDPNNPPIVAHENDVWFNTNTTPNSYNLWNGTAWVKLNVGGDVTGSLEDVTVKKIQNINVSNTAPTNGQLLTYVAGASEWQPKFATNWNISGNTGTNPLTDFLGTTDDVRMQIRSNDWPMLEFGKRGTLGLIDYDSFGVAITDYDNSDQPVVYLKGDTETSALQFVAKDASYYKPMFFTTAEGGNFRLKGSSAATDLFEIGSAGIGNKGRLEFVIGDDGEESIIFKRYDWRSSKFNTEFFRVQGSNDTQDAKTRFGININPQHVAIDPTYTNADTGVMATSTFEVNGSVSKSIFTTTAALTLTEDHHTIVLGGNHAITLPTANTCKGRIYVIKNPNAYATVISSYINEKGVTNITTVNNATILWLQSDGANWQQISNGSGTSSTGKSLYSVTTKSATTLSNYNPANTTSWITMDGALSQTSITVQVGDIVDVRVNISEQFSYYDYIGDLMRLYVTDATLIGSPVMIQTIIAGGDNANEVAAGSLSQMFTVTKAGTLTIGIQVKYASTANRSFSTTLSGIGGLQAIIYR